MKHFASAVAGLFAVIATGCSGASSGGHPTAQTTPEHVVVTSSITDGSQLSASTTWQATVTGLPAADHVTAVQFLVDGKKTWSSQFAPFVFNMDGYPFWPWVLGTGAHVLTAQATTSGGKTASTSVHVTVGGKPPLLPTALDGTFRRTMTAADVRRTSVNQANRLQPGTFTMQIRPGLFVWEGSGTGANEVAVAAGARAVEFNTTANWLVPQADIGGFCETPEPAARYSWSLTGNRLTLRPVGHDGCANRDSLLTGTWVKR